MDKRTAPVSTNATITLWRMMRFISNLACELDLIAGLLSLRTIVAKMRENVGPGA